MSFYSIVQKDMPAINAWQAVEQSAFAKSSVFLAFPPACYDIKQVSCQQPARILHIGIHLSVFGAKNLRCLFFISRGIGEGFLRVDSEPTVPRRMPASESDRCNFVFVDDPSGAWLFSRLASRVPMQRNSSHFSPSPEPKLEESRRYYSM